MPPIIHQMQSIIDYIEEHLKEELTAQELAQKIGYSTFHFYKLFYQYAGSPVMDYILKRRLQHAIFEISQGKKIIQAALEYGFETHSGFTKAFKKCFGSPPRLYSMHCPPSLPLKPNLASLHEKNVGGVLLQPKILETKTISAIGYLYHFTDHEAVYTRDAPAFWSWDWNDGQIETNLYQALAPISHGEYCINMKNEEQGGFSYLFALSCPDSASVPDTMARLILPPSLYAVFQTPKVLPADFAESIRGTWRYIIEDWLPLSPYEVSEQAYDFEFYDELCHHWLHEKICMSIYLPISLKTD